MRNAFSDFIEARFVGNGIYRMHCANSAQKNKAGNETDFIPLNSELQINSPIKAYKLPVRLRGSFAWMWNRASASPIARLPE